MLSLEYSRHVKLYNDFGLFIRKEFDNKLKAYGRNNETIELMGINGQKRIHAALSRISKRHNGLLPQARQIANGIRGAMHYYDMDKEGLEYSTKYNTVVQFQNRENERSKMVKKLSRGKRQDEKVDISEYDDEPEFNKSDIPDLIDLSNIGRKLRNQVPIIIINHPLFLSTMPSYMITLGSYLGLWYINHINGLIDENDTLFKIMFKSYVRLDYTGKIIRKLTQNDIVFINYDIPLQVVLKLNNITKNEVYIRPNGTLLTFQYDKNFTGVIQSRISPTEAKELIGTTFIDNYKKYLLSSIPYDKIKFLRPQSVLIKYENAPYPMTNMTEDRLYQKLMSMMLNESEPYVNLVVIGNKGSGKTTVLREFVKRLNDKGITNVLHLSSDSYGKWRYATCGMNDDVESEPLVDPESLLNLDNDDEAQSVYEIKGCDILKEWNVLTKADYLKLNEDVRMMVRQEFGDYFMKHLRSDFKYGERFFYDKVNQFDNVKYRLRIIELHCSLQQNVNVPTVLPCMLSTINDPLAAVICRPRGGPEQILLTECYELYNNEGQTPTTPLLWSI